MIKEIIFWGIVIMSVFAFASAVTLISQDYSNGKQRLWVLRLIPLLLQAICIILLICGSIIMWLDRKPAPKREYEQITTPVYKLKE